MGDEDKWQYPYKVYKRYGNDASKAQALIWHMSIFKYEPTWEFA